MLGVHFMSSRRTRIVASKTPTTVGFQQPRQLSQPNAQLHADKRAIKKTGRIETTAIQTRDNPTKTNATRPSATQPFRTHSPVSAVPAGDGCSAPLPCPGLGLADVRRDRPFPSGVKPDACRTQQRRVSPTVTNNYLRGRRAVLHWVICRCRGNRISCTAVLLPFSPTRPKDPKGD